jgi:hypothetical protein
MSFFGLVFHSGFFDISINDKRTPRRRYREFVMIAWRRVMQQRVLPYLPNFVLTFSHPNRFTE